VFLNEPRKHRIAELRAYLTFDSTPERKLSTFTAMKSLRFVPPVFVPIAIFLAFFPMVRGEEAPEHNLIKNANFENGANGWELVNYGKGGTMAMDRTERHNGKPTLRIESFGQQTFARQAVKVKPHTTYLLSAYIKVKDVQEDGGSGTGGAIVMMGMSFYESQGVHGTTDWQ